MTAQRQHAKRGRTSIHRPVTGQLLMGQDQGGVTGERAEHVNCFAVVQVVEAAAQRLAIERNRAQCLWCMLRAQVIGVAAERGFEIVVLKRQEQVAQRVHCRSAPETGTEDGVQALALKGDDLLVGGRTRQHGENREQQQVAHAVALALGTARVRHFGECGKQVSEWHGATLRSWKVASIQPLRFLAAAHVQPMRQN